MIIQGSGFALKTIDKSQLATVLLVYQQCEDFLALGPVPKASLQMVIDDFTAANESGSTYCGIFINDQLVGIADFISHNYDNNPHHAYISLIMIASPHRQRGLGREVINTIEAQILADPGITTILASVQTNNEPAIRFWTNRGYKVTGGPELMPDSTEVYHLQKDI